jgi:hypothetical protein
MTVWVMKCDTSFIVSARRPVWPRTPLLQKCATVNTPCASCSKGGDASSLIDSVQPYYRITSRVRGPRNTVSYVQVIMY